MNEKKTRKRHDYSGSSFDSFLDDHGIREEAEAVATKRVLAWELKQAMRKQQKFSALRSHRVPAVAYGWFTASRRGSRPDVNFLQYPPTGISYTFRPVATAYDWKGESKPWQSQPIFSMKMSAAL